MADPIILTDSTLEDTLKNGKPALILVSNGDGVRGDFITAFKKAIDEHGATITFAKIDPSSNPIAAEKFGSPSKALMVGWVNDQELVRRSRPWGADVPLAVDMLKEHAQKPAPAESTHEPESKEISNVTDKPVAATDETFESEVLESDLPVLIDFWAEWCGPCRMVAPILDKLAGEFAGKVKIVKVNVDENPGLSASFRIQSIPNMMAVKQKTIVFNQPGALPEPALRDLIEQLIALEIPEQPTEESSEPSGD